MGSSTVESNVLFDSSIVSCDCSSRGYTGLCYLDRLLGESAKYSVASHANLQLERYWFLVSDICWFYVKNWHSNIVPVTLCTMFWWKSFLIGGDGNVYEGTGWSKEGAHTYGWNKKSLGLVFIGNFQGQNLKIVTIWKKKKKKNRAHYVSLFFRYRSKRHNDGCGAQAHRVWQSQRFPARWC